MTVNFRFAKNQPPTATTRSSALQLRGRSAPALAAAIALLLGLVLSACGSATASSEQDTATRAIAEQHQANLNLTDDLALTELLNGETGTITNLQQVVTGDRPVLVWYWAPN